MDYTVVSEGCLNPSRIIELGEYPRLVISAFLHADDWHLYYNMASLLYKGTRLERHMGTGRFLCFILIAVLGCGVIYVAIAVGMVYFLGESGTYYGCGVGFSGVLFAMKVLVQSALHNEDDIAMRFGFP